MRLAKCYTAHLVGLSAEIIMVEVDISNGLNAVSVVGLGDRAIEEAKDRVSAAIKNSGFTSPKQKNQKVVISLAPADVRKEGTAFDLPIALTYLIAAGEISLDEDRSAILNGSIFLGELSLEGQVRKVAGILPILCQASERGFRKAFIPSDNAPEASLAHGIESYAVRSLSEAISLMKGELPMKAVESSRWEEATPLIRDGGIEPLPDDDMYYIRGNVAAKRSLEISAAGGHNILMYGPPGTGKTMLARSLASIMPPLTREESIEVTGVHSAARNLSGGIIRKPPFRAPHHTASYQALVGGGASPRPGEVTLAHRGILFLDEIPEFDRATLEALRQPLEDRLVTVSRARGAVTFPAQCILVASMNPCRCGKPKNKNCSCTEANIRAYRRRISGPILDRIDLWVNINNVDYRELSAADPEIETSAVIAARVSKARSIQAERFQQAGISKKLNSEMSPGDIERCALLDDRARKTLERAAQQMNLSGRGFHRVIKTARTIADLESADRIYEQHILEALRYRQVW